MRIETPKSSKGHPLSIPPAILIAVEFMRKSFGGTEVEIVSEAYRLEPSEDAPAGALGCDITVKILDYEMTPVKTFLRNSIAEDMAWSYGQMIADEMVFMLLKPEFDKLKEKFNE
jgi:hypothetical protein